MTQTSLNPTSSSRYEHVSPNAHIGNISTCVQWFLDWPTPKSLGCILLETSIWCRSLPSILEQWHFGQWRIKLKILISTTIIANIIRAALWLTDILPTFSVVTFVYWRWVSRWFPAALYSLFPIRKAIWVLSPRSGNLQ